MGEGWELGVRVRVGGGGRRGKRGDLYNSLVL